MVYSNLRSHKSGKHLLRSIIRVYIRDPIYGNYHFEAAAHSMRPTPMLKGAISVNVIWNAGSCCVLDHMLGLENANAGPSRLWIFREARHPGTFSNFLVGHNQDLAEWKIYSDGPTP